MTGERSRDHRVAVAFWTAADIVKLKAAIADGALEVEFDGPPKRRLKRHSMAEMRALLAEMRAEVEGSVKFRRTTHNKGFRS